MIIEVDDKEYKVRHNYLHRGTNPRLVLNIKEFGGLVWVQFNNNDKVYIDLEGDKKFLKDSYDGYWCNKTTFRTIEIKIIEN